MSNYLRRRRRRGASGAVLALVAAVLAMTAPAAAQTAKVAPDLLELPAMVSPQQLRALQLAVSRAGKRLASAGEGGVVLLSDDGGASWRQSPGVPVSVALTDVAFVTPEHGWAVGHSGVVLHSRDGGEHWRLALDGVAAARLVAEEAAQLTAAGAANAAAATRNAKAMTADGPDKPFLCVFFADPQNGWALGAYGLALATRDGGLSWRSVSARLPNPGGKHLYRMIAAGGELVIVGEQGTMFRSTDGGESFSAVESPYEGTFFGALPLRDGGVLAFGLRGNVWRVGAGLEHWRQVDLGRPATVTAGLRLSDGAVLLADEGGRLTRSADDGLSFRPLAAEGGAGLTGLAQAADGAVIASGVRGNRRIDPTSLSLEAR